MGGMATEENSSGSNSASNTGSNNFSSPNLLDDTASFSTTNFNNSANTNLLEKADAYSKPLTTSTPVSKYGTNSSENNSSTNSFSTPTYGNDDSGFEVEEAPEIDHAKALKKKNDLHLKQQLKMQKEKTAVAEKAKQQQYKMMDQQKKAQEKAADQARQQTAKIQQDAMDVAKAVAAPTKATTTPAQNPMQNIMQKFAEGAKKAAIKKPADKIAPALRKPVKQRAQDLVSEEAKADNEGIKNTLINKSSEVNGLPPVIDSMLKEDSLGGKAVTQDLINRVRKEDPETAQKLELLTNPIFHKYAAAIQKEQAKIDRKHNQEMQAYQQYEKFRLEDIQQNNNAINIPNNADTSDSHPTSVALHNHIMRDTLRDDGNPISIRNNASVFTNGELRK